MNDAEKVRFWNIVVQAEVSLILKGGCHHSVSSEDDHLQAIAEETEEGKALLAWMRRHQGRILSISAFVLYNAYLAYAIYYHMTVAQKAQWDWCEGLGFLLILTALAYLGTLVAN